MTQKVFWDDSYLSRSFSFVTSVEGESVVLDSTIFFAFSGGQESDEGTIGGHAVLEAQTQGKEIVYTLPEDHGLYIGEEVEVRIDWSRRYRLMRLHFAAELVLETVYRAFPGIEKRGAHIAESKARLDFALDESISPYLSRISEDVLKIIGSNLPITSAFEGDESTSRYWEIEGFAKVPCGGTHLRRTGEIGSIALKRNNRGKGRERIEIFLVN